jgi:hypothetical protein
VTFDAGKRKFGFDFNAMKTKKAPRLMRSPVFRFGIFPVFQIFAHVSVRASVNEKARGSFVPRAPIRLSQKQNKQDDQTNDCLHICGNLDTNRKHEKSMLLGPRPQTVKSVT